MTSATILRPSPARAALSQEPVYDARPQLRFSGESDARADTLLLEMQLEESEGGMASMALSFSNWASTTDNDAGLAFPVDSRLRLGAAITVLAGDRRDPKPLFEGTVTSLEEHYGGGKAPRLVALAEDGLQRARLARRSRVFTGQSPADVVRDVCAELGLRASIDGLAAPVADWVQFDETDLAFLRRLLCRFDRDLRFVSDEVRVEGRADAGGGAVRLNVLADLQWLEVGADLAHQVTEVSVRGWDASAGTAVLARASSISNAGPGEGEDGAALLRQAFGARQENLAHLSVASQEEADALAHAVFDRRARAFVTARGSTEGNPLLRVGTALELDGTGGRFDNTYRVTLTRHRFCQTRGYRTEFEAECGYVRRAS
jgi:phage protein D